MVFPDLLDKPKDKVCLVYDPWVIHALRRMMRYNLEDGDMTRAAIAHLDNMLCDRSIDGWSVFTESQEADSMSHLLLTDKDRTSDNLASSASGATSVHDKPRANLGGRMQDLTSKTKQSNKERSEDQAKDRHAMRQTHDADASNNR